MLSSLSAVRGIIEVPLSVSLTMKESVFLEAELRTIQQAGPEAMEIASFFKTKIEEAKELVQETQRRYERILQAKSDGELSRFHESGNREGDSGSFSARAELAHAVKYFNNLWEGRNTFVLDPRGYSYCAGCGQKIPRERHEEVPHTRWCVSCKNKNNGNGK